MSNTPEFLTGKDSYIVLNYGQSAGTLPGEPGELAILGLNTMSAPPYTTSTIAASEYRKATINIPGETAIGDIPFGGNLLVRDPGQRALRYWWQNQEVQQFHRFYFNERALTGGTYKGDFVAADLAQDATAGFNMGSYTPGDQPIDGVITVSMTIMPYGRIAYFTEHYVDVATPVMAFAGSTITGVPASFSANPGDTLIVEGATTSGNDGYHEIVSLAATTLTVSAAFDTDEAAIEGTTIHGGCV